MAMNIQRRDRKRKVGILWPALDICVITEEQSLKVESYR